MIEVVSAERSYVLSTLTKVLIVLLSLSAIFLCGIVITYVTSANNYKEAYEKQLEESRAAESLYKTRMSQFNERMTAAQRTEDEIKAKLTELESQKAQFQADLAAEQRNNYGNQERVKNLGTVVTGLNQTIASMDESLKLAREQLDKTRSEQVKNNKELNEISTALNEKTVQLETLEAERRRLLEQKTTLEDQIAKLTGRGAFRAAAEPVTLQADSAKPAPAITDQVALQGKVLEVDSKNSIVTISMGSADGVRNGMKFHVVRADAFVCDVVITNIDVNKSAGVPELVQQQPKVGDVVKTNL